MAELLTIGQLAERTGVATSALRFYEDRGLITSERTGANHRRYPRPVIRRVAFIIYAQRAGLMTLEEIGEVLARLPEHRSPGRSDWARLHDTWRGRIDARIAELEALREGLTDCIGCGCLSLDSCRFANPDDRLAATGPGPAAWRGIGRGA